MEHYWLNSLAKVLESIVKGLLSVNFMEVSSVLEERNQCGGVIVELLDLLGEDT
jgi:hypothetical protein